MITHEQLESIGFRFHARTGGYTKSYSSYGVLLKSDGTVSIDNPGAYEPNSILFDGIDSFEELKRKLGSLGDLP